MLARIACAILAVALLGARAEARPVEVRDLTRVIRLADPRVSPDGRTVVLVESQADLGSDQWHSELITVDLASHERRQLTHQRLHASSPRWSPRGDRLGFLAPDSDKTLQLFVMSMAGGDAEQLTTGKAAIGQFA